MADPHTDDLAERLPSKCPTCGSEALMICTNACRWPDDEPSPWLVIPNADAAADATDRVVGPPKPGKVDGLRKAARLLGGDQ